MSFVFRAKSQHRFRFRFRKLFLSRSFSSSTEFSRFVRFLDENGKERIGAPMHRSGESDGEPTHAQLIEGAAHSLTDRICTISKFLPPLPLLPVPMIFAVGLNYRAHVSETLTDENAQKADWREPSNPIIFGKNPNAIVAHRDDIIIPKVCVDVNPNEPAVDFESELAVIIGRPALDVSEEDALSYVFGYTIANDVSARDWQLRKDLGEGQWIRGKSFNSFCPLGPVTVLPSGFPNGIDNLRISSHLNGEEMQNSSTSQMIFSTAKLISFLSQDTTLLPGTVILTGTPEGVGFVRDPKVFLKPNDTISCEIENIGRLENSVVSKS
uniref:oxaloacetate tautomerase n=1 Tax=Hirondellea gigas TaxID=1518452 RepID=A0A6A7G6P7_9CRUS